MVDKDEKIIIENINLIYHILKKYNLYKERDEYFDIGVIGLIKGVRTFNHSKNTRLSTYLTKCISSELLHYLRANSALKRGKGIHTISIYTPVKTSGFDNNAEIPLIETIEGDTNILQEIEHKDQLERIYNVISKLDEEEKFMICSSFGVFGYPKLSQEEIAIELGYSQPYISRATKRIISSIKDNVQY